MITSLIHWWVMMIWIIVTWYTTPYTCVVQDKMGWGTNLMPRLTEALSWFQACQGREREHWNLHSQLNLELTKIIPTYYSISIESNTAPSTSKIAEKWNSIQCPERGKKKAFGNSCNEHLIYNNMSIFFLRFTVFCLFTWSFFSSLGGKKKKKIVHFPRQRP